jgi:ribosomal-protein-alanine N-acetyltransferase
VGEWRVEPLRTAADLDGVLEIEEASFTNPWTREMYLADLARPADAFCFVARDEAGSVVGFCSFWRVVDEIHINNLAVAPAIRRAGVASALLARVLTEGGRLGARAATLEVRRSNMAALALYARFGFIVGGVRRNYYTNPPEDALILWRRDTPARRP